MVDSISLYNAVCKINNKLNEIIVRLNTLDPGSAKSIVNSVNGKTGDVTLTGNDVDYSARKTVNAKIDENSKSIESVKQDIANLTLENVLGESSAQIQIMTQTAFNAVSVQRWNDFYEAGFRIVGVADSTNSNIQQIYLQNTSEPHTPIPLANASISGVTDVNGLSGSVTLTGADLAVSGDDDTKISAKIGSMQNDITATDAKAENAKSSASAAQTAAGTAQSTANTANSTANSALEKANSAYSPNNAPPYPVTSVNGKTGAVTIQTGGGSTVNITTKSITTDSVGRYSTGISSSNFIAAIPVFSDSLSSYTMNPTAVDGKIILHVFNIGSDPASVIRSTTFNCILVTKA